jgi:hypothetical protein
MLPIPMFFQQAAPAAAAPGGGDMLMSLLLPVGIVVIVAIVLLRRGRQGGSSRAVTVSFREVYFQFILLAACIGVLGRMRASDGILGVFVLLIWLFIAAVMRSVFSLTSKSK